MMEAVLKQEFVRDFAVLLQVAKDYGFSREEINALLKAADMQVV